MANITYANIIEAIKAIRAVPLGKLSVELIEGRQVVHQQAMCLKEAKDITEAIMALGVRRYLTEELAKANRDAQLDRNGQRFAHVGRPAYGDGDIKF